MNTAELRRKRVDERRAVKELNNIGKRLCWLRLKLGLTQKEISLATDIPNASYNGREAGVRTDYNEEYIVLATFFNVIWQSKYKSKNYPLYEGSEVKKITPMWLQYGSDDTEKDHEMIITGFKEKILQIQKDHFEREQALKRQLTMFEDFKVS